MQSEEEALQGLRPIVLPLGRLARAGLACLPLALFAMPVPLSEHASPWPLRIGLVSAIYLLLVAARLMAREMAPRRVAWLAAAIACACLGMRLAGLALPAYAALPLLLCAVASACAYCLLDPAPPAAGIVSLLLLAGSIAGAEGALQSVPAAMLRPEVASTPPLSDFVDRGNEIFLKNGFRGKLPCRDCPAETIRIFSMGGSSTYGIPMYHTTTSYAAVLQRLLDRRRVGERYDVLNAGIPGYGITQILDSLRSQILKHDPDIVTVCAWFNDSAPTPGWYRIPGKSDMEAYKLTRFLQGVQALPIYRELHASRLFALFRYYMLEARGGLIGGTQPYRATMRPRMTPEEFGQALRELIALGEERGFLPVFIPEPLNRSLDLAQAAQVNGYYREMIEAAREHDIPLVDVLTPISQRADEWFFYDIVHTNEAGHRLIAEQLYASLFDRSKLPRKAAEFLSARGVDFDLPQLKRSEHVQIESALLAGGKPLRIAARAPYMDGARGKLEVLYGGELVASLDGIGPDERELELSVPAALLDLPIVDLTFRARAPIDHARERYRIGTTGSYLASYLLVESGGIEGGKRNALVLQGQRHEFRTPGLHAYAVGEHGELRGSFVMESARAADDMPRLLSFLRRIGAQEGTRAVVLAANTNGAVPDEAGLASVIGSFGGSGRQLPELGRSYVFIGAPGAAAGSAIELSSAETITVELGEPELPRRELSQVRIIPPS